MPETQEPLLRELELPIPIGSFILAQEDIEPVMTPNGGYYHYSQVCILLGRLKKSLEV